MAPLTPFTRDDAKALFALYEGDRRVTDVELVPIGTVNSSYSVRFEGGERVFVRIYEEQGVTGAVAEAARLETLAARGVRTPPPLPLADGSFVASVRGKPTVVFPWRSGGMRCLASVTPDDARRVGRALAEVHVAGRDLPVELGRFEPRDLFLRLDRLEAVPFPAIAEQVPAWRHRLASWAVRRDPTLPTGLVHGDVFRDNVLWDDEREISALLDFESASKGVLAYDLMVTVLAWSFRDTLDASIARAVVSGYESARPLEDRERRGLLAEGCVAAIRFTITRLTDAELRAAVAGTPCRRDKDWRRFALRFATLEKLGDEGLASLLFG